MPKITLDLSQAYIVRPAGPRVCSKVGCKSTGPFYRHHKGNDGLLGLWDEVIKANYYKYLDCCDVCNLHHKELHWYLQLHGYFDPQDYRKKYNKFDLSIVRTRHIQLSEAYLTSTDKLHVPKEFTAKWVKSLAKWKRRRRRSRAKAKQKSLPTNAKSATGSKGT